MLTFKIKYFVDNIKPHIHIDRAFQRKVCWPEKTRREFILSANRGRAFYPIVVADVKSGIKQSEKNGKEYSCRKYESAINSGMDYISLDGQNRAQTWEDFFNNKVHLSGTFIDADGSEVVVVNSKYSQLPERLQDALRDTPITMAVADDCYYDDLHDIFVNLNSGCDMNPQEIRNAINTEISGYVREVAGRPSVVSGLTKVFGKDKSKFERSYDAEYVLKAYMATLRDGKKNRDLNLNKNDLDTFYIRGKGKESKNVPEYHRNHRHRFINIMDFQSKILEDQAKVPQKIWWLSLFVAEKVLYEDQKNIDNYSELYDIITTLDSKLCDDTRQQMGKDLDTWKKNGEDPEEKPSTSSYYHQWSSDPRSANCRLMRKETFFDELYIREDFLALLEASKLSA